MKLTESQKTIEELLENYRVEWLKFCNLYDLSPLFVIAKATAFGWKTENLTTFYQGLEVLLENGKQAHIGAVDERLIASVVLNRPIGMGVRVCKLMQRRPGSKDPVGLDHVDFTVKKEKFNEVASMLEGLAEKESNEAHSWLSLRFGKNEAKFFDHTVLDIGMQELKEVSLQLRS